MPDNDKKATPLSTMLNSGDFIEIKEEDYKVKPILIKDVEEFVKDNLSIGSQFFALMNEKERAKTDKWLSKYCFDSNDNPVSLKVATEKNWDIVDLKIVIKKMCDISG